MAIDAIYSIGAHLTNEILNHKQDILACLEKCKTDRSQPVRAAAQETIKLIKDLDLNRSFEVGSDVGEPLGEIESSHQESQYGGNLRLGAASEQKQPREPAESEPFSTTKPYLQRSRSPLHKDAPNKKE